MALRSGIRPLLRLVQLLLFPSEPVAAAPAAAVVRRRPEVKAKPKARRPSPRAEAYDAVVAEMKDAYGFRVRRWRRSMSGCAWELRFRDGRVQRMLESPYPKSPLSCAIFLHEVGHHAIGLGAVRPRCLEELRAWEWSFAAMEARGLEIDDRTRDRFRRSMEYAVAKATRRGIARLPEELRAFLPAAARA